MFRSLHVQKITNLVTIGYMYMYTKCVVTTCLCWDHSVMLVKYVQAVPVHTAINNNDVMITRVAKLGYSPWG